MEPLLGLALYLLLNLGRMEDAMSLLSPSWGGEAREVHERRELLSLTIQVFFLPRLGLNLSVGFQEEIKFDRSIGEKTSENSRGELPS